MTRPARWRRRLLVVAAFVAALLLVVRAIVPGAVERRYNRVLARRLPEASARASRLHEACFVADLHADTLLWQRDLLDRSTRGHVDLPRLREGGVGLQVFSVVTHAPGPGKGDGLLGDRVTPLMLAQVRRPTAWWSARSRAFSQAAALRSAVRRSDGRLVMIRSREDLDALVAARSRGEDVTGALLALEGAAPLEGDVASLDALGDAGVRMIGLAHFADNAMAGSLSGRRGGGLTKEGRELVRAMQERGFVVDLAHCSPATVDDVLAMATRPVIVSHAGVRGTCDSRRNLSDGQLRRLAANGGVVGIAYFRGAACDESPRAIAQSARHAARVAGVAHVALGSDFDGAVATAFDASQLRVVTHALLDEGFSEDEVCAILGGNALRVLRAALTPVRG